MRWLDMSWASPLRLRAQKEVCRDEASWSAKDRDAGIPEKIRRRQTAWRLATACPSERLLRDLLRACDKLTVTVP